MVAIRHDRRRGSFFRGIEQNGSFSDADNGDFSNMSLTTTNSAEVNRTGVFCGSGHISSLSLNGTTNGSATPVTYTVRIEALDTDVILTVGAGLTGQFLGIGLAPFVSLDLYSIRIDGFSVGTSQTIRGRGMMGVMV